MENGVDLRRKIKRKNFILLLGVWFVSFLIGLVTVFNPEFSVFIILGFFILVTLVALSFRYENFIFYIFVISLPFESLLKVPGLPNPIITTLGGLAILVWLLQLLINRSKLLYDRTTLLLLLFGIWTIISAVATGGIGAVTTTRQYWLVIILYILTQNTLREKKHFITFGWVLALSLGAVGAYIFWGQALAFIQTGGSMGAEALHWYANNMLVGIKDSAIWSMRISKGIPYALYLSMPLFTKGKVRQNLLLLCAAFMVLGPVSTVSINGTVGIVATIGLVALLSDDRKMKLRFFAIGIVVLVLILMSPLMDRVRAQVETIQSSDPLNWGTYRVLTWYTGIQHISNEPIFGLGPDEQNLLDASLDYISIEKRDEKRRTARGGVQPHNVFLTFGASLGIPGLLIFISFFVLNLNNVWFEVRWLRKSKMDLKMKYIGQAVFICTITLLVQFMAISVNLDNYVWVIFGTAPAFVHLSRKLRKREIPARL